MTILNKYTSCVRLVRTDAVILGMTELDKDLTIDSQLYEASISYIPTELQSNASLAVNNADTKGFLTITGLNKADIVAGLYDHAQLFFFLYDYENEVKVRDLGVGWLGEVTLEDNNYTAEYRSLTQKMQQTIGRVYGVECDATLGDTRCGVTLASFTETGTITSITSNSIFTDSVRAEADDHFNYGLLTFTSGLNAGLSQELKDFGSGQFTTQLPFPYAIAVTDAYSVYRGCNKTKAVCRDTFSNVINFRGFDYIPGQDSISKFGGQ